MKIRPSSDQKYKIDRKIGQQNKTNGYNNNEIVKIQFNPNDNFNQQNFCSKQTLSSIASFDFPEKIQNQNNSFPDFWSKIFEKDGNESPSNQENEQCEQFVRQQIQQLDLEEEEEQELGQQLQKTQKQLTLNENVITQQEQNNYFYQSQYIKDQKNNQQNSEEKPIILSSLSCKQFKEIYLQDNCQNQSADYNNFRQQNSQCQPYPNQIVMQTIHNPFILEISQILYTGHVKYFDQTKEYGFILINQETTEIFFHYQDVTNVFLSKDYLSLSKQGMCIQLSFNICIYRGKTCVKRKAVNLNPLM